MTRDDYIRLGEPGLYPRGLLTRAPEPRPLLEAQFERNLRRAREAAIKQAIVTADAKPLPHAVSL